MNALRQLAALKSFHYGHEHVVVRRTHGFSVMSLRLALLCGAQVMAATLPPPPVVVMPRPEVARPESVTTCHLQTADGCWSPR